MKKFLIIFGLVLGFASAVYADGYFCCSGSKEECCAVKGKMYCPNDNSCRTRCPKVTPPECIGGCINPEGVCCAWCPSMEVCEAMGKCQKIVDGCYQCVECPEPNPCTENQCMNEDGVCCDSCPRVCPEGECLVNVDGCYQCGECDTETTDTTSTETEGCDVPMVDKWLGDCCDEGTRPCCPSKEDCSCYPTKDNCECEPPKKVSSEGVCCDENWVFVTDIDCMRDGLCYLENDGCPICIECSGEPTETEQMETETCTNCGDDTPTPPIPPTPTPDDDDDDIVVDDDDDPTDPTNNPEGDDDDTPTPPIPPTPTPDDDDDEPTNSDEPCERKDPCLRDEDCCGEICFEQHCCDAGTYTGTTEACVAAQRCYNYNDGCPRCDPCDDYEEVGNCGLFALELTTYEENCLEEMGWYTKGLALPGDVRAEMFGTGQWYQLGSEINITTPEGNRIARLGYEESESCPSLGHFNSTKQNGKNIVDACCPSGEGVACSSASLTCCKNAKKIPDGKRTTCSDPYGGTLTTFHVCCSSEDSTLIEKPRGSGQYVCCSEDEDAVLVQGGKEDEYMCCKKGSKAYFDGLFNQCCEKNVVNSGGKYVCCDNADDEVFKRHSKMETSWSCCRQDYNLCEKTYANGVTITNCCQACDEKGGCCKEKNVCGYGDNAVCCTEDEKCCDGVCKPKYLQSVQKDGTKGYACCDEETYIQKAEHSTRGVEACCSDGGTAFVTYPWDRSASSSYWFEPHPEYGMTDNYSNCCIHSLVNNVYGGQDCCTPIIDSRTGKLIEQIPMPVKGSTFERCCPKGGSAYYTGTVEILNEDTGEKENYPTGRCCDVGNVVVNDEYGGYYCCDVSEGSGFANIEVQGAPEEGFETCCAYNGEKKPEAYWTGFMPQCCYGTVYETKEGVFECCEDGKNVVDVVGENIPENQPKKLCCPSYEYNGEKNAGKAYWNGDMTACCSGEIYPNADGTYRCCPIASKYNYEMKEAKYDDYSVLSPCTIVSTGEYMCCECDGEKIFDFKSLTCVDCPEGSVKADCYRCVTKKRVVSNWSNGTWTDGTERDMCYFFRKGEHVSCVDYSINKTECSNVLGGVTSYNGTSCDVCPEGKTHFYNIDDNCTTETGCR